MWSPKNEYFNQKLFWNQKRLFWNQTSSAVEKNTGDPPNTLSGGGEHRHFPWKPIFMYTQLSTASQNATQSPRIPWSAVLWGIASNCAFPRIPGFFAVTVDRKRLIVVLLAVSRWPESGKSSLAWIVAINSSRASHSKKNLCYRWSGIKKIFLESIITLSEYHSKKIFSESKRFF